MPELLALVIDELGRDTGAPRAALTPLSDIAGTVAPWFAVFTESVESAHPDDVVGGDLEMAQQWSEGLAALAVAAEQRHPDAAATACDALALSLHMVPAADAGAALTAALSR